MFAAGRTERECKNLTCLCVSFPCFLRCPAGSGAAGNAVLYRSSVSWRCFFCCQLVQLVQDSSHTSQRHVCQSLSEAAGHPAPSAACIRCVPGCCAPAVVQPKQPREGVHVDCVALLAEPWPCRTSRVEALCYHLATLCTCIAVWTDCCLIHAARPCTRDHARGSDEDALSALLTHMRIRIRLNFFV